MFNIVIPSARTYQISHLFKYMGIRFTEFFRSVEKYNEPQINADERRFVNPVSAFICVHLRLIEIRK